MVVPGRGRFSYERGTPVRSIPSGGSHFGFKAQQRIHLAYPPPQNNLVGRLNRGLRFTRHTGVHDPRDTLFWGGEGERES